MIVFNSKILSGITRLTYQINNNYNRFVQINYYKYKKIFVSIFVIFITIFLLSNNTILFSGFNFQILLREFLLFFASIQV